MSLTDDVRSLLDDAIVAYAGRPAEVTLRDARARLDQPVRVAIAGKVKAGKSTLLNALVGEALAPTDAGECTRIVTWYHDGPSALVHAHLRDGDVRQVRYQRAGTALDVDLGDTDPATVERLDVQWPSQRLRELTLIDTPGTGSISADVSQRSIDFLVGDDEGPREADAVLYLMRHVHSADVSFLEAFHDEEVAHATPVTAIGVLSRADEAGACRLDAPDAARRIAARYAAEPSMRRLCQTVVPVAGLVAQASASLTEAEYRALATLAQLPEARREHLVLSADRFVVDDASLPVTAIEREDLLERLGLYGARVALHEVAAGTISSARELVEVLRARSGLDELRALLVQEFGQRAGVLTARSALDAVAAALREDRCERADELEVQLERVLAGAHELAEIRVLNQVRSGAVVLRDEARAELERLLGSGKAAGRLACDDGATPAVLRDAAMDALKRWQARGESPLSSQPLRDVSRVAVRTCEGLLAAIPA